MRQSLGGKLAGIARVQAWWSNKFSPLLATFYASVCYVGAVAGPLVPRLLLLLLALAVGATYVSVLNDWTDLADDLAGGKANYWAGKPAAWPRLVLGTCLVAGLGMGAYFWRWSPLASGLYLGSWVAFTCYSLPPFRFKNRGLAGVLVDASGSHFFPQLLTVTLVAAWTGHALPGLWYGAVGLWALACGLRHIVLHQLDDVVADELAGVKTWVSVRGFHFTQRLGQRLFFPLELLGLGVLLWLSQQVWPLVLAGVYVGLEGFKWRLWSSRPRIIEPGARMLLNDYYEVFYPLGFLLALGSRHPQDWLVLVLHLLLFAQCFWQAARHLGWAGHLVMRKLLAGRA